MKSDGDILKYLRMFSGLFLVTDEITLEYFHLLFWNKLHNTEYSGVLHKPT